MIDQETARELNCSLNELRKISRKKDEIIDELIALVKELQEENKKLRAERSI